MRKKKLRSCLFHWQKNVVVVQAFGCNYNSLAWCGRVERIAPHHAPQASKPKTGLSSWPRRESQKWLTSRIEKCGVEKKLESPVDAWRIVWCNYSKNRAQKAKPEVLCQSKATMAVLTNPKSLQEKKSATLLRISQIEREKVNESPVTNLANPVNKRQKRITNLGTQNSKNNLDIFLKLKKNLPKYCESQKKFNFRKNNLTFANEI